MIKLTCAEPLFNKREFWGFKSPKPKWYKALFSSPQTFFEKYFLKKEFLQTSAFYPCSWGDDRPINYLSGFVYSFIYCDVMYPGFKNYKKANRIINEQLLGFKFGGYRCVFSESILLKNLTKESFYNMIKSLSTDNYCSPWDNFSSSGGPNAYFCLFEKGDQEVPSFLPKYITVTFVKAEVCHFYHQFYNLNKIVPKVLVYINPGMPLFQTVSLDYESDFLKVMRRNRAGWPPFIFTGDDQNFDFVINDIKKFKDYPENMKEYYTSLKEISKEDYRLKSLVWEAVKKRNVINLAEIKVPLYEQENPKNGKEGAFQRFYYIQCDRFMLYHFPFGMKNSWKFLIEFLNTMTEKESNKSSYKNEDEEFDEKFLGAFDSREKKNNLLWRGELLY